MKKYQFKTTYKKMLADTITPVSIYLKLRDRFPHSIMLESSDYHGNENSYSYICCNPIASVVLKNNIVTEQLPDGSINETKLSLEMDLVSYMQNFLAKFEADNIPFNFFSNGLFGYISYDALKYFEEIEIPERNGLNLPELIYSIYQNVIIINHFKNELYLFEHLTEENQITNLELISSLINNRNIPLYQFHPHNDEQSNFNDAEFLKIILNGISHCLRGDVFQMVLSRRFNQSFHGDEFNVYRTLRSINPSPYLFYFDYGNFKVFGSSPESQILIKNNKASIFPIAGTFKRTGNDEADAKLAEQLKHDPKENAEHVMLVDLARNDLSRNGDNVQVKTFKEIQYYSHVIHLVSEVSANLRDGVQTMKVVADTFPAGTLTGAPKYKAMQLINKYENCNRGLYGGCIGFIGFNGDFNHAIIIRSIISKNNVLYYQAGAGIVAASDPESELKEVNNKLLALKNAIEEAKNI